MARVLVVDDDLDVRESLRDALVAEGHEVELAEDGERALELVVASKERPPQVILLDLRMPRWDGREFMAALAHAWPGRSCPIVLLTAGGNARIAAAELGAEYYLAKPFDLEALLQIVERAARAGGSPGPS
jgi:DNA-binding response OmpR family regulator